MSELSTRLHLRRKELGLSQEELAQRMGYRSKSSITKLEKGINDLPQSKVEELAAALETTPAYLLGLDTPCPPPGFEPLPAMTQVPLIGSIACGTPITAEQNIERYIGVPAAWRADFALTCHGDSMSPTICDGDIVCIRCQPEVEQGEIAAVRIGGEATLKHFHRQGDAVMLLADNAAVCPPMDGLILPDVPFEEKAEFDPLCRQYGLDLVSLIAPTSHDRIRMIAKEASGFVYCVSSLGVTGVRSNITTDIGAMVKLVKKAKDIPCAVGFGISTPEQAKKMAGLSDGAIVGSAIVKLCGTYGKDAVPYVKEYVKSMCDAVHGI